VIDVFRKLACVVVALVLLSVCSDAMVLTIATPYPKQIDLPIEGPEYVVIDTKFSDYNGGYMDLFTIAGGEDDLIVIGFITLDHSSLSAMDPQKVLNLTRRELLATRLSSSSDNLRPNEVWQTLSHDGDMVEVVTLQPTLIISGTSLPENEYLACWYLQNNATDEDVLITMIANVDQQLVRKIIHLTKFV
jgi:hypothetical protein